MKLQYLGDYRDAFKWDLLHWTCTTASPGFSTLQFVPLLTPDDAERKDGQIPHRRFAARPFVHHFVDRLRSNQLSLGPVAELGRQPGQAHFTVAIHASDRLLAPHPLRAAYWHGLDPIGLDHAIVFLDPDNGFETKTQRGPKWVRHAEVAWLIDTLPTTSAVIVYQHRPRLTWPVVLADLRTRITYAPFACAAYDASLAFIALARERQTFERIAGAFAGYAAQHATVKYADVRRTGA